MQAFKPCIGRDSCLDFKGYCLACGRKLETIERTRKLIDELASIALAEEYSNIYAFMEYIAKIAAKKVASRRNSNDSLESIT